MQNPRQGHYHSAALLKEEELNQREMRRCPNFTNIGRKYCFVLFFLFAMFAFISGVLIGYFTKPHVCLKQKSYYAAFQNRIQTLLHTIDVDEINHSARFFASEPHYPGSQRQKELAEEIKKRWESYGFDVHLQEYDVLLSTADENNPDYIKVVNDKGKILLKQIFMTQAKADPNDNKTWNIPRYFFYSPSRHVSGGLLYANEGRKEDFEYLKNLNISSCRGSVVIIKQIFELHFRAAEQMKNAFKCNAEGVIFFRDKDPDASLPTTRNNTYPNGVWLPRDSPFTTNLIRGIGDPMTPGLPATTGIYRLNKSEIEQLPKLPVQLVDYNVAKTLLTYLKGSAMPNKWKPKSDKSMNYRVGPYLTENATFYLAVNVKTARQKVYNVIGIVYGSEEPDHWVLVGNHRDSIAFGGSDAVSGTAGMMEVSRGIGELLKKGWTPRRTIKFISWAAEEAGLIGSNEWVEDNLKLLQERAVAYINMDMLVHGNHSFKGKGNPMLTDLIFSQTKLVHDPHGPTDTIYSVWKKGKPSTDDPSIPHFPTPGASTDYQPFYELAGVPCLELQYTPQNAEHGDQPYHTPYDTYHWIKLVDPYFKIHLAQAQLIARLLLNLTDSLLLPFNLTYLSTSLQVILQRTKSYYGLRLGEQNITLDYISEEVKKLSATIQTFEKMKSQVTTGNKHERQIRMFNRRMVSINKMFLASEGVPNRPWIRNLLYGISKNMFYPNITLVAISDAIIDAQKSGNWTDVKRQVSVTHHCIKQAKDALQIQLNI